MSQFWLFNWIIADKCLIFSGSWWLARRRDSILELCINELVLRNCHYWAVKSLFKLLWADSLVVVLKITAYRHSVVTLHCINIVHDFLLLCWFGWFLWTKIFNYKFFFWSYCVWFFKSSICKCVIEWWLYKWSTWFRYFIISWSWGYMDVLLIALYIETHSSFTLIPCLLCYFIVSCIIRTRTRCYISSLSFLIPKSILFSFSKWKLRNFLFSLRNGT